MQELELLRTTSSGGAGVVKRCGSDSSCFELMFNIKNMFQNGTYQLIDEESTFERILPGIFGHLREIVVY
jgi:hypothetical protein